MTTPDFKTIAGVSRKYLIPLIEHLDAENLTIRVGEVRKLRSG
ncbi:MAG: SelB C-terminal domain-containing protein [Desulfococcaceae bacterium]